jgi:hypothetical protein
MGLLLIARKGITVFTSKLAFARPLVIPTYHAVPVFINKNLLRTSGMSRERFFELFRQRDDE